MKRIIFAIAATFALLTAYSCDKDHFVEPSYLPVQATEFIKEHFSQVNVVSVKKEHDFLAVEYDVYLSNGTEITFDKKGVWKSIDCERQALPSAILPQAIRSYVESNYPDMVVEEISKEHYGYEVGFMGGLELHFNKSGKLVNVDH